MSMIDHCHASGSGWASKGSYLTNLCPTCTHNCWAPWIEKLGWRDGGMSYSPVYPDLMILGFFGFFWCKLSTEQLHSSNRAGGQTLWSGRYFLEVSCSWFLARSTNEKLAEAKERRSCCARNPRREQVLSMSSQVLHSDIQGGSRHAAAQPLASTTSTCWSTSARCQFQLRDVRVISAISQCFWKIEKQWSTGDKQSLNIAPATQHPRRSQNTLPLHQVARLIGPLANVTPQMCKG